MPPFRYRLLRKVFYFLFRLLTRVETEGVDRLPMAGPYLIVANHLHLFDPAFMFAMLGDRYAIGFVGSTHRRNPLYRLVVWLGDGIWLRRGEPDRTALRLALQVLERGHIFGMAPEGTRSKTGALMHGKAGAAFLAYRAGVPLYPAAFINTEKIASSWKRLRRQRIRLVIGEPFDLASIEIDDRSQRLAVWTEEIMCRIAALLPDEYRGVYADHPRLYELLAAT